MKKNLLSFLLMVSVNLVFSQAPCNVSSYTVSNGGSSCPDYIGAPPTGTITLSFDGPIGPIIPTIDLIINITDPSHPFEESEITVGPGALLSNNTIKYCYYPGPNKNNNLAGGNAKYEFVISPCVEQAPLPVSFRVFTALRNKSTVALKWTTAVESNNVGFEIQRLAGDGNWQTLAFIATLATGGNSSVDLIYTYTDLNTIKGISQYRIRQVDIDGRSKLSEIRAVRGEGQSSSVIVYPNPSNNDKVNIVFEESEGARDVLLQDVNGRVIKQWKGITNNTLQVENLNPGFYTVRIINTYTREQTVEKIIVKNR